MVSFGFCDAADFLICRLRALLLQVILFYFFLLFLQSMCNSLVSIVVTEEKHEYILIYRNLCCFSMFFFYSKLQSCNKGNKKFIVIRSEFQLLDQILTDRPFPKSSEMAGCHFLLFLRFDLSFAVRLRSCKLIPFSPKRDQSAPYKIPISPSS